MRHWTQLSKFATSSASSFAILGVAFAISLAPSSALAAKFPVAPDLDEVQTETPQELSIEKELGVDTVDLPPLPPPPKISARSEYFHPYRYALTVRIGQVVSSRTRNDTNTPSLAGVQFFFMTEDQKSYEAGADLLSDGSGALHLAKRWVYAREKFRPYTKLGAGIVINPDDRLVTILKYENYQLRGAAGFEILLKAPASLRVEIEAAASTNGLQANGTLGYVWAW